MKAGKTGARYTEVTPAISAKSAYSPPTWDPGPVLIRFLVRLGSSSEARTRSARSHTFD